MNSKVLIVDDHPDGIEFLRYLCASVDLSVSIYQDPHRFLEEIDPTSTGCCLIDLRMPQMGGLELLARIRDFNSRLAIVILTNHADVAACREAFQHGAFDFVQKDSNQHSILEIILKAIRHSESESRRCEKIDNAYQCLGTLTSREREVLDLLVEGKSLKDIACQLSITVQTASKHRLRVLQKFDVENEVELVVKLLPLQDREMQQV